MAKRANDAELETLIRGPISHHLYRLLGRTQSGRCTARYYAVEKQEDLSMDGFSGDGFEPDES